MPDAPLILAFDTSAAHCAAALLSGGQIVGSVHEAMQRGQAESLMGLCEALLQQHDVTYRDLTAIGVGVGPGNFTGVRISVSAARGLALGLGIPAIGVTMFEALRYGTNGPCACTVDARRGQVYFQAFSNGSETTPSLEDADTLPPFDGPMIGVLGQPPARPIAEAIALCARQKLGDTVPPPAPLYLRPADAAPARDKPPVILS